VRAAVVDGLDGLGLQLDPELNNAASKAARLISTDSSPITIAVVPTNEELAIAQETAALLEPRND
jgi:acetate kinase